MSFLHSRERGFTLLELIVAFALLSMFILPLLQIITQARVRAFQYTRDREVRNLAQQKLYDYVYSIEPLNMGSFDLEGHPNWTWEILPPHAINQQSAQPLLQFTIQVRTPAAENQAIASGSFGSDSPAYELSLWTHPSGELLELYYQELEFYDPTNMGMLPGYPSGY